VSLLGKQRAQGVAHILPVIYQENCGWYRHLE
jgi:hypothetical protein